MLADCGADVVILATGAEKVIPPIPGIDLPHVTDAFRILGGEVAPGKNIVIIGGGMIGMETADFLIAKGTVPRATIAIDQSQDTFAAPDNPTGLSPKPPNITIIEMLPRSPVKKFAAHGYMLHKRLRDGGGRLLLGAKVERIREDCVLVSCAEKGEEIIPADQVIIAVGTRARCELKKALEDRNIRHFLAGDASQPRRIIEAVEEGARAAWSI
jgi:pyruvate/2-oxoglutarate dehydrogenase complex dihydrolipoamide dehydrogenase (E3) component